jgi:NCK-associated protein 1
MLVYMYLNYSPHSDVDNVLQRMTIVGVILSFRQLAQNALVDVLEERIPFLLSSILDFRHHFPSGGDLMVSYSLGSLIEYESF